MARSATIAILLILVGQPAFAESDTGTVTLALEELLRLHKAAEQDTETAPSPPVGHAVSRFETRARIIGDALEATASVKLAVFRDGWTSVPILKPDPELDIIDLPTVQNGHFISQADALVFVTETAGTYTFEIGFIKRASRRAEGWEALVKPAGATIQKLVLTHDENLFEVTSTGARREGDTLVVVGRDGLLRLSWKTLRPAINKQKSQRKRPPIEPVVTSGTASVVVTLDGQRITRSLYRLRFQGPQTLAITVPEGQELTKVYLNGISRPFERKKGTVDMLVTPPRLGDQGGVVEVVLKAQTTPMALAGTLGFTLPTLSWGINEMGCQIHLPSVFNYVWMGGSLSPGEVDTAVDYTYDIPTPGKTVAVKQQLVNGAPHTAVKYAVDLAGNYFQ